MSRELFVIGANGDRISLNNTENLVAGTDVVLGTAQKSITSTVGVDGLHYTQASYRPALSSFTAICIAESVGVADQARRRFERAVNSRTDRYAVLGFVASDGTEYIQQGEFSIGEASIQASDSTLIEVPVTFQSGPIPFWVSAEPSVYRNTIGVAATIPYVGRTPFDWAGHDFNDPTIPFNGRIYPEADAVLEVFDSVGDVETWPVWRLLGPAIAAEFASVTTGGVIRWEGNIAAGEVLEIDTDPANRRVSIEGVDAWQDMALTEPWPLVPDQNHVWISIEGGTDGTTILESIWSDRYIYPAS